MTTEQLFTDARTHNGFTDEPVSTARPNAIYDLMKRAPTSAKSSPARIVFVTSPEAREKLLGSVSPGNIGRGDPTKLFGRSPRLAFEEACRIVWAAAAERPGSAASSPRRAPRWRCYRRPP